MPAGHFGGEQMKIRTLLLIYIVVIVFVFVGVYLSESATNQLLGLGRSPQVVSFTPWEDGGLRVQILGKEWAVDKVGVGQRAAALFVRTRDVIRQQLTEMMAR